MRTRFNLLSISFDKNIALQKYSDARERQLDYAKYFREYKIIILNTREDYCKREKVGNLSIIPTNSAIKPLAILDSIIIALREHQKVPFDLITAQDPLATGLVAIIVKRLLKLPLNIQLHIDYHWNKYWPNERWQNRLLIPLIDWEVHQAASLRVDNKAKILKLKNKYPNLAAVIFQAPMRIDIKYFYKKAKKRNQIRKLVAVGRLIKQKNHPLLIKSIKKVIEKYPKVTLTIVGGGKEEDNIRKLITEYKLSDRIQLTGSISRKKVKEILHKSDLFVLASNHEGWGLVYVEAFAAGLPIVTTQIASAGEVVKNNINALLAPIADEKKLASNIITLIEKPQLAFRLARAGQQNVMHKYQKEKLISKWIEGLYKTNEEN
jgi:glycosyltransferase involved in cell wall biosynthesis